ncbi:NAD(P)-binding protein [Pleomassaria siparia CBS 279.74]|uniref:NAD(P)-binding protein n=1 Tax=Pleomassaria siparia CBS 279.74 TaxID=1314801 RepID=A0A6G1KKL1_9PLEO|nr:NAD(P)-binding protein [Pleomassaria siparia CBS 279.74]
MASFTISDSDFADIKDKVVIVTGASSGIGLATVKRLLTHGAKVYAADLNPPPEPEASRVSFLKVDVTSWAQQLALFKAAFAECRRVDHVFANAGINSTALLTEDDVDENGDLLPPKLNTINVNLIGVMYTVKLGIYYIGKNVDGGSIVMTASSSSVQRFTPTDYTTAKHGVLGLLRSLYGNLYPKVPIRINAIAPSWTETGIVPKKIISLLGPDGFQSPDVVARSVLYLFASPTTPHGQLVYSDKGRFWDTEGGEEGLIKHFGRMLGLKKEELLEGGKLVERSGFLEDVGKGNVDSVENVNGGVEGVKEKVDENMEG